MIDFEGMNQQNNSKENESKCTKKEQYHHEYNPPSHFKPPLTFEQFLQ